MRVKMTLSAKERRDGVDLRDILGHGRARPKTPRKTEREEFRPIEHIETTLHDTVRDRWDKGCDHGGVRIYCTSSPRTHGEENARWSLQVRAQVKRKSGGSGKHFAVGTASMSREDLLWLRDQINFELRNKR